MKSNNAPFLLNASQLLTIQTPIKRALTRVAITSFSVDYVKGKLVANKRSVCTWRLNVSSVYIMHHTVALRFTMNSFNLRFYKVFNTLNVQST